MDDMSHKTSSFGVFGWTNYSPAGLTFLGILALFPRVRKAVGYLILALIVLSASMIVLGIGLGPTASDLDKLALLPLLGAALLFLPFWLPAVILDWFGKKAFHRFTEIAAEAEERIDNSSATARQELAKRGHCCDRKR